MSPVNSDDSSGGVFGGAGRPLTPNEFRNQRQVPGTEADDVSPPQPFETGGDVPTAAPDRPAADPTVHEEPVQGEPLHEVPVHDGDTEFHEPVHDGDTEVYDPVHGEPVQVYPGGVPGEETFHTLDDVLDHDPQRDAPALDGHAVHPDGDTRYVYVDADGRPAEDHEEDGHVVLAGGAAIRKSKGPSKKVRRRRRILALLLTLSVFVVALVVGAQFLKPLLGGDTLADYPGPGTGEVLITVPPGAGPKSVASQLQDKNVVASADTFLQEFLASGGALVPGDFTMRNEMKNSDAVAVLLNKDQGKVMYFALSAGLRIGESLEAISGGTGVPVAQLRELSDSPTQFGAPAQASNLEGFLAPGEYRFPLGTPAKDVLQKLVTTTLDELISQGVTDPAKQYDVITVASIVQAEGGQAEYGDVAGAIYNRLKPDNIETNGLIQSDATVTYGLGIKSFHIDEAQKADASNPYNTYANQGLPVGPIGSPGKTAIDAAAKPKTNDYLYWVTINLDTKETVFSKTLAEHNVSVERYNAWCGANPGRCV